MTAPKLVTDRLVLDAHRADDLDALAAMWGDPAVTRFIGGTPRTREEVWLRLLRHVGQWTLLGIGMWVVRERAGGAAIGEVGLLEARRAIVPAIDAPEVGWTFAPAVHGRGYAGEALGAVLGWADARGVGRLQCIIDPENAPSLRLAGRHGFSVVTEATYHERTTLLLERVGQE